MTQEDIIRMAREVGAVTGSPAPNAPEVIFTQCLDIRRFAALVAAAENEECAVTADEHMQECEGKSFGVGKAIRARGQA